jgi:hypothetical protein
MSKPLIQIDDLIREMTDEEHAHFLESIADAPTIPTNPDNA